MQESPPVQPRRADEPLPEAREVAAGIWKITLPIPFPLRTVNVYALVGPDGWALVDAGMGTPEARAAFASGLRKAGLDLAQLRALVLTHHHPDHVGLSGELQELNALPVYMHALDERSLRIIWDGTMPDRFGFVSQFFRRHGLEKTTLWYTQSDPGALRAIIRVPPREAFTLVEDGAPLTLAGDLYRVYWVPGHSDGQITLLRERDGVYLAADHVLPRITPNIGLYSEQDRPNPLSDYLASLQKVAALPASLVLPGHGEPFQGLAQRTQEIAEHHRVREEHILALLVDGPRNAAWITEQLFQGRLRNDEMRRMAMAEVLAHLAYSRQADRVEQQFVQDGQILFALLRYK